MHYTSVSIELIALKLRNAEIGIARSWSHWFHNSDYCFEHFIPEVEIWINDLNGLPFRAVDTEWLDDSSGFRAFWNVNNWASQTVKEKAACQESNPRVPSALKYDTQPPNLASAHQTKAFPKSFSLPPYLPFLLQITSKLFEIQANVLAQITQLLSSHAISLPPWCLPLVASPKPDIVRHKNTSWRRSYIKGHPQ